MNEGIEDNQKVAYLMAVHGVTKGTKKWGVEPAIRGVGNII